MFPKVFKTLEANAAIVAIVGNKIGRHGSLEQKSAPPYITWFTVADSPHLSLSETPPSDFTSVQIDCWSIEDGEVATMAREVRNALDAANVPNRVITDLRESATKLYRVGIEADFITQR